MTGMTCQTLMKPQQFFCWRNLPPLPNNSMQEWLFVRHGGQQTWWTKCVSKHLAYPFPMTYFSTHIPEAIQTFFQNHWTYPIISHSSTFVSNLKKCFCLDMVSSPVPPGEDIKTKRHSWATQVLGADVQTRTLWDVCVGSFGNGFVFMQLFRFGVCTCCGIF